MTGSDAFLEGFTDKVEGGFGEARDSGYGGNR